MRIKRGTQRKALHIGISKDCRENIEWLKSEGYDPFPEIRRAISIRVRDLRLRIEAENLKPRTYNGAANS
jgi:hypothetical protein